ncbi:MAG: hypothetical protein IKS42_03475 [Oscillospiraceae bacterium]|nr:hypothetical protein [Oscillospiraceae bacterium]
MLMLPDSRTLGLSLGKWRYFLTGLPLAVLLGLIVRALGKLAEPFGMWRRFTGTCEAVSEADGRTLLTVSFQDSRRLAHTAAFYTEHPDAKSLHPGDETVIALRSEVFAAGSYAGNPAAAHENDSKVLLRAEHRAWLRRTLLRVLIRELLLVGAALGVFLFAMHFCFPS